VCSFSSATVFHFHCTPALHRSPKRTADQAAVLPQFILPVYKTQAMIYHYYTKVRVGGWVGGTPATPLAL
jgi:hypothetical protein